MAADAVAPITPMARRRDVIPVGELAVSAVSSSGIVIEIPLKFPFVPATFSLHIHARSRRPYRQ
jgi:hypothetical protein